jgi:iron complex outermembrane recepter protein
MHSPLARVAADPRGHRRALWLSNVTLAIPLALLASPALGADGKAAASDAMSAAADESSAAAELGTAGETVIVIGSADRPISVAPRGLAISLGEADFSAVNALNVEDLMKYAPNFFVRKRYIGDANAVPGFRGTHSTQSARSIVMVDGFVVSNFLGNSFGFPPKWGVVGPGEVRQFDIVYGPYSSRFSGHSMGGVVSITTRAPEQGEAFATVQAFAQPYDQYGTSETYVGGSLEVGASLVPQSGPVRARVSWRHFENTGQPQSWFQMTPATGAPGTPVTGAVIDPDLITKTPVFAAEAAPQTVQDQVKLRVDTDLPGGWTAQTLLVAWASSFDTTQPESYLRDGSGNPVFSGRVDFGGATWTLPAVNLSLNERLEYLAGLRLEGEVAGWNLRTNLSRFWIPTGKTRTSAGHANGIGNGAGTLTSQEGAGWTTLDLIAQRDFGVAALALGFQTSSYETTQNIFSTANWREASGRSLTNVTGGASSLTGFFLEGRADLSPSLAMTVGMRAERWTAEDGRIGALASGTLVTRRYPSRSDEAFSPSLSASWDIAPDWTAQLSLAGSTRFPTVGELFQGRLNSAGEFDINSFDPDLRPERSRDANLLLRRSFERSRLTASVFWQEVSDTIFSVQGFNQFGVITSSFKNVDLVRQHGVELIAETDGLILDGLAADINLAWIDSRTVRNRALPASEGVRFPRIPEWRINGNLRYRFAEAWQASLGWRYASRPNSDLAGTLRGDTFGYASEQFIVDVRLARDFGEHLQLAVGVDNIGNDAAWAFHPFPQRTVSLELRWRQ